MTAIEVYFKMDYDIHRLISVVIKEIDYNSCNEQLIISLLRKYIRFEYGEVYSTSESEMPLLYAETKDKNNLK